MHLPSLGVATLVLSAVALPTDSSVDTVALVQTFANRPEALALPDLSPPTRRQSIDFALADGLPDPVAVDPNSYNRTEAINAVVAETSSDPLPQKRDSALVGRDASIGYTSSIPLGNAAINAPLNCNNADTYMGSRLWNDGFFDETRCAAACTAQSIYNAKHPPSNGQPKLCQFYNTYILLKNGAKQGQYCTLYTQAWDASRATNKGQNRGQDKFTIDSSFIATNATDSGDVSCPSDVPYLSANGADFCTAYISYAPPTLSSTVVSTPPTAFATSIETVFTTSTAYSITTQTSVVSTVTLPAGNQRRAVQTPASVNSWSPSRISAACSQVATGKVTTTLTSTAPTQTSTVLITTVQTTVTTQPTTLVTLTTTTTTAAAACVPTNVISNGGFESSAGYLAYGWTPSGTVLAANYQPGAHSGDGYGVFQGSTTPVTLTQSLSGLSTSGKTYKLAFYMWRYSQASSVCILSVSLGGKPLVTQVLQKDAGARALGYSLVASDAILPTSQAADLAFTYSCDGPASSYTDSVFVDDVAFESVC